MYVVTFYSFKGGVGRSMALVNVAAELAKSGKKVLIVDFDLEAPGIPEFDLAKPSLPSKGLVEFVSDYIQTREVPIVDDYVYTSNSFDESGGQLLVMAAGRQDDTYQDRFSAINWQKLYEEQDGFLFMEDMRLQWQERLGVDYVFIDSRTGYTDIAGICTRQLPDAVCMLFVPNKQNLKGVSCAVNDIRAQHLIQGLRHPKLHFVASNVPDVTDDKHLLDDALKKFRDQLGYDKPCAVIYHYDSFHLLNEAVFTLDYPTTKLAEQYRTLAHQITKVNFQDKKSALRFLRSASFDYPSAGEGLNASDVEEAERKISSYLGTDAEVVYWMSRLSRAAGNLEASRERLEYAINHGLMISRAYLDRALILEREGSVAGAITDVEKALAIAHNVTPSEVLMAIHLSLSLKGVQAETILTSPALNSLSTKDLTFICEKINYSQASATLAEKILSKILISSDSSEEDRISAQIMRANSFIAIGELSAAKVLYEQLNVRKSNRLHISFNLGMVDYWLGEKEAANVLFQECLSLLPPVIEDSNEIQCKTFALWVVGRQDEARNLLAQLQEKLAKDGSQRIYSCWRYLEVSPTQFSVDLHSMDDYFNDGTGKPSFLIH